MRKKSFFRNLAGGVALLAFLFYIGYQVVSSLRSGISTVEADMFTVEDTISAEGVFIRDQKLIKGGGENAEYLAKSGEKVSKGQEVAVFFGSHEALESYRSAQSMDDDISSLTHVYESLQGGADASKLDEMIYQDMLDLTSSLSNGDTAGIGEAYADLRQMVCSRSTGAMDKQTYTQALDSLKAQKTALLGKIGTKNSVKVDQSGYFIRGVDGYETVFTADKLSQLNPDQVESAKADQSVLSGGNIGSLVNAYQWYFAAVLSEQDAQRIKGRTSLEVYFPQLGSESITLTVTDIRADGKGKALVLLQSGMMQEKYLNVREGSIDIVVAHHEGIKIPHEALRQVNGKWGVYCLDGGSAHFKEISWTYQTDSYYLAVPAKTAKDGIYPYDRVIINQRDIDNNKAVEDK